MKPRLIAAIAVSACTTSSQPPRTDPGGGGKGDGSDAITQFDLYTVAQIVDPATNAGAGKVVLTSDTQQIDFSCERLAGSARVVISSPDGSAGTFSVRDFYANGCSDFIQSLLKLGVTSDGLAKAYFAGPNRFPALFIGGTITLLVYAPQGSSGAFSRVDSM